MLVEVSVPTTALEDALRRNRRLEGTVDFHSMEFDDMGLEMVFKFSIDDENFYDVSDPQHWVQEYAEDMIEDTLL